LERASLNAERRGRELSSLADGEVVDVLVVGGGVTGAGAALDAASRGLSVALVEKHDLAFGTSRWSSKLVHGGLRYLAQGAVGIAHESARERGIVLASTAPHLARPIPVVIPLLPGLSRSAERQGRIGLHAGDALRRAAGTSASVLPRTRRVSASEAVKLTPAVRRDGLRGALVSWDAQLEDDARFVVALARTAAAHGARILTRVEVLAASGDGARVRDRLAGTEFDIKARSVINATGVWAGDLAPDLQLRPSRGSHLVLDGRRLGNLPGTMNVPVPGEKHRWVFAIGHPGGRAYVGLTDEPVSGPLPDVPEAPVEDVEFLLRSLSTALDVPLGHDDVIGTYAGLRPLVDSGDALSSTADLSRRHAVFTGSDGVVTVTGGKLTTYRKMAEDAVDAAVAGSPFLAGASECRTHSLPLIGAADAGSLARVEAPRRVVDRFGTEAPAVVAAADGDPSLLAPVIPGSDVLGAEILYALRHEGALDIDDVLDRRTRIGLVPRDRDAALPVVRSLLADGAGTPAAA
jgi:glycerol-3-phosphate dehydrogenase